jgi:hypothetical protein
MIFKIGSLTSIVLLVMVTIGSAGEISVGDGISVSVSADSSAQGTLTADDSAIQSSVSSAGLIDDLNIDPWVRNTNGDYAEIGVTGTNVAGFSYSDNYYPGKGGGWISHAVWAQQWIDATSADSLHAYARASNSAGDSAGADLDLKYGSLKGYYNAAYAGPAPWLGMDRVASVQQTLYSATGSEILAQTWAVDPVGDAAGASTSVKQGTLYGYSVLADAARYSNGLRAAGVEVDSARASAPYGSIQQIMAAIDYWGDKSQVIIDINRGYLYNDPYYSNIPTIAYSISDWGQTYALQSYDAEAVGFGSYIDRYRYATPYTYYERMFNRQISWDEAYT